MTWAEYVAAVNSHLVVESARRGTETARARIIRNGVLDLQRYIRRFRGANTDFYHAHDLIAEGSAHRFFLPENAKPKAFYIYSAKENEDYRCFRHRLEPYAWNSRKDLICGQLTHAYPVGCGCNTMGCGVPIEEDHSVVAKAYVYCLSPQNRSVLIHPQINDSTRLLLVWEGYKYVWHDEDIITFPEESSEAVASYVLARLARNVDKNLALAREHETEYTRLRLSLWRDDQEAQATHEKDEEYENNLLSFMTPNDLVGYGTTTNNSGNTTITIGSTKIRWSELTTLGGSSGTNRLFALSIAPTPITGAVIRHRILCPETAGIYCAYHNGTTAGSKLTGFTTDGSGDDVVATFVFDGTMWTFDRFHLPQNA